MYSPFFQRYRMHIQHLQVMPMYICVRSIHPMKVILDDPIEWMIETKKEVILMREGLIPTILGASVTAAGYALRRSRYRPIANAVIGFGLAHVVLGTIDLVERRFMPMKWV